WLGWHGLFLPVSSAEVSVDLGQLPDRHRVPDFLVDELVDDIASDAAKHGGGALEVSSLSMLDAIPELPFRTRPVVRCRPGWPRLAHVLLRFDLVDRAPRGPQAAEEDVRGLLRGLVQGGDRPGGFRILF